MTELSYYVATTLDGYIAHEDGSYDGFVWDDAMIADFFADLEGFGTVLMGRKTYEVGLKEGKTSPYPGMRQILFSRTLAESPDEAVELVREGMVEFVRGLKASAERPIWLCGGGQIASALAQEGLIDQLVVKLNPVAFGSGIPLFHGAPQDIPLELTQTKVYDCGIVVLRYRVA